jgi:hypothetical protein
MRSSSLLRPALCALLCLHIPIAVAQRGGRTQTASQVKPQSDTPYLITGIVINSVDQSPLAHCHITASPTLHSNFKNSQFPAELGVFDCDERGHFSVPVPSAGSWRLTASARGFVTQDYEQHQSFSSAIILTPTEPTINLQFHISPEASITGVVVDEAGEPIRTAEVSLQVVPPSGPDGAHTVMAMHSATRTDDRGQYELAHIPPGEYRITVRAQPWYAVTQAHRQGSADTPPLDPSLDFAYPLTWFPGVDDPALAETISLHAGDTRQADFHLIPVPSGHIRISPGPGVSSATRGRSIFPMVQPVIPGSAGQTFMPVAVQNEADGQIDIGGLPPGKYRIRLNEPNQQSTSSLVEVGPGSVRNLDPNASSTDAKVTLQFDGLSESGAHSTEVNFIDTDTGRGTFSSATGGSGSENYRRGGRRDRNASRTIDLPAGRYGVALQGRSDLYLTGIIAHGAEVIGRYVTLPAGASTIMLHLASGHATLAGVVTSHDKPSVSAMVLLVPTTIEEPNSLRVLRQDQTNTDGSFDLTDVIPGQYILLAIDHGWQINWSDPLTLHSYLSQGVPVDLASGADVKQNLKVQNP